MQFLVNDVTLDFFLERYGFNQTKRQEWIDRLRDDFNERYDNSWVVKRVLELTQPQLSSFVDHSHQVSFDDVVLKHLTKEEATDLSIRFAMICKIIETDHVAYMQWKMLKSSEPTILDRYSHCYFGESHLVVMFEEFDE